MSQPVGERNRNAVQDPAHRLNWPKTYIESKPQPKVGNQKKEGDNGMMEEKPAQEVKMLDADTYSIEDSVAEIKRVFFPPNKSINQEHANQFETWANYVHSGMNLCLFGVGSKTRVAEALVEDQFQDWIQVKIKGSSASVKTENILMKLLQLVDPFVDIQMNKRINKALSIKRHRSDETVEILLELFKTIGEFGINILLLFLDIDGKNFRELESHRILSELFKSPHIKMIATLTNTSFPVLLTSEIIMKYKFCFQAVHTYEPNELELISEELCWFNQKETKGTNAIKVIYAALTDGQKEILKLLAAKVSESATGQILYSDFYEHCLDEMIVSSEPQMNECLKEAISHAVD